jgi:hypothetical protein
MSEPQWIHGDPIALSLFSCEDCDKVECTCGEPDPDRMYDEMMEG